MPERLTPEEIRAAAIAAARKQGCSCAVVVEVRRQPVSDAIPLYYAVASHDDWCPLMRRN